MNPPRVAICVLTRGYSNVDGYLPLIERTQKAHKLLRKAVRSGSLDCSFIVFHEGNIPPSQQQFIAAQPGMPTLNFVSVAAEFSPKNLVAESDYCRETKLSRKFTHGYKCMCAFWLNGFLGYVEDVDYVVRIDEDCTLLHLGLVKLIAEMRATASKYCTAAFQFGDPEDVVMGLDQFCQDFCDSNGLAMPASPVAHPFTNFFVLDYAHYRNDTLFDDYSRRVRETGCIHINRWGDLPLWGYYLAISRGKVLHAKRVSYRHGSHNSIVNEFRRSMIIRRASRIFRRLTGLPQ